MCVIINIIYNIIGASAYCTRISVTFAVFVYCFSTQYYIQLCTIPCTCIIIQVIIVKTPWRCTVFRSFIISTCSRMQRFVIRYFSFQVLSYSSLWFSLCMFNHSLIHPITDIFIHSHTHTHTHTHSLIHSHIHILTHSHMHSLTCSLTHITSLTFTHAQTHSFRHPNINHSLVPFLTDALTHLLIHSNTHTHSHSNTHTLTHPLTHLHTHSPIHLLTHVLFTH